MTAWLAAVVYLVGFAVAFGLRGLLHYRATGDAGFRRGRPAVGGAAWWAQLLLVAAVVLGIAAPMLAALNVVAPLRLPGQDVTAVVGLVMALLGFAGVVLGQQAMGRSWRVGVDVAEQTDLVTTGVFALARNPVFTAMVTASVGLTLAVPSWLQLLALASLVAGVELQVRAVEEPYLARTHGPAYGRYAARVGRFLPAVGRMPTPAGTA